METNIAEGAKQARAEIEAIERKRAEAEAQSGRIETENDERRFVLNNPQVVRRAGWLPRGLWSELDERAKAHDEAVARWNAARREAANLGARFEAEDEARIEAYKTGLATPKMTDPAERERAVAEAKAKVDGAERARDAAAVAGIRTVQEHEAEWQADLKQRDADAKAKREEAARLLEEASWEVAGLKRTQHWVMRTAANNRPRHHISHDTLPVAKPEPPPNLAAILGVETLESQ